MDFEPSEEQRLMVSTAANVGQRFGLEYWRAQDAQKAYPKEAWLAICKAGLGGVALPDAGVQQCQVPPSKHRREAAPKGLTASLE